MKKSKFDLKFSVLLLLIIQAGCLEKDTNDPNKAYRYWAGEKPGKEVQVINGQYWASAHWTKEYIMYLELKVTPIWHKRFITQNHLKFDTTYAIPSNAPSWFKPGGNYQAWKPIGFTQGSVYLADSASGHVFIYEIQL